MSKYVFKDLNYLSNYRYTITKFVWPPVTIWVYTVARQEILSLTPATQYYKENKCWSFTATLQLTSKVYICV